MGGTPFIIYFNRLFHYKPSIWGYPNIYGNHLKSPMFRWPRHVFKASEVRRSSRPSVPRLWTILGLSRIFSLWNMGIDRQTMEDIAILQDGHQSTGSHMPMRIPIMGWMTITGWWFSPTPLEKKNYESVGMMTFPTEWNVIKFHGSKAPSSGDSSTWRNIIG